MFAVSNRLRAVRLEDDSVVRTHRLTGNQVAVLLMAADRIGTLDGECTASAEMLAGSAGPCKNTANAALRALVKAGFLVRKVMGQHLPDRFTLGPEVLQPTNAWSAAERQRTNDWSAVTDSADASEPTADFSEPMAAFSEPTVESSEPMVGSKALLKHSEEALQGSSPSTEGAAAQASQRGSSFLSFSERVEPVRASNENDNGATTDDRHGRAGFDAFVAAVQEMWRVHPERHGHIAGYKSHGVPKRDAIIATFDGPLLRLSESEFAAWPAVLRNAALDPWCVSLDHLRSRWIEYAEGRCRTSGNQQGAMTGTPERERPSPESPPSNAEDEELDILFSQAAHVEGFR